MRLFFTFTTITFQDKVRQLRKERKLSLKKLAKDSKVNYHTLVNIERKESNDLDPHVTTVIALARFFEITLDEMLKDVTFRK